MQKDEFLKKIFTILKELLITDNLSKTINFTLSEIGAITGVDRVYIFENSIKNGEILTSQKYEWTKNHITAEIDNQELQNLNYKNIFQDMYDKLSNNSYYEVIIKNLAKKERIMLEEQNIKSMLEIPIFVDRRWFGFIGFDDCVNERIWSNDDKAILSTLALAIAGAMESEKRKQELVKLNLNLEKQIQIETKKSRDKDILLFQQSKYTQMGELLSMIAHEWRQPLNILSIVMQSFTLKYQSNEKISSKDVGELEKSAMQQINFMSQTIDNFRNFFKSNNKKEYFKLPEIIIGLHTLVDAQLNNFKIKLQCICNNKDNRVLGYKNELIQVILNLIVNSRDAFVERNIKQKEIVVKLEIEDKYLKIVIRDNAGGIDKKIQDKLFNPYFSTKDTNQGTSLDLYMIKSIIENSMKGKITIKNITKNREIYGTQVEIYVPIVEIYVPI